MEERMTDMRTEYPSEGLMESDVFAEPLKQFEKWWQDAVNANIPEVNAMTLATASADGMPSARIVLLKGFSAKGFVFFTNYQSYKGHQLVENPRACLVFFWQQLHRQVRITGVSEKNSAADSDAYFHSRPRASQAGAVASPQSAVIESREWLDDRYRLITEQSNDKTIQRPAHWGGYIVKPVIFEFWQGRPGRLHDRIQYSLMDDGTWKIERLAP